MIPRTLLKLRTLNGKKLNGVRIKTAASFHSVTETEGTKTCSESAKRIMSATQAVSSSRLNSTEIQIRALWPNAASLKNGQTTG